MFFSPFWDSFVSGVEETAAGAICGLPLTGDNYEAAKNILKKRSWCFGFIIQMESLVKIAA